MSLLAAQADQREAADAAVQRAELELAAIPPPVELDQAPATADAEARVAAAERARSAADAAVGAAERVLGLAQAAAQEIVRLEGLRDAAEQTATDWRLLAEGLRGVIGAELDALGPTLTGHVNEFLWTCYGGQFSVSVDTIVTVDDGKREVEGCCFNVQDSECQDPARATRDAREYSPGQQCLIGTAFALALARMQCERSGTHDHTMVLDEFGAGLDVETAPLWVAMVRHAAERMRANKVLIVSHSPDVQALMDARVNVADGRLTVN